MKVSLSEMMQNSKKKRPRHPKSQETEAHQEQKEEAQPKTKAEKVSKKKKESREEEVNDSPATGQEAAKESNDTDANEVTAQWDTIVDSPHTYDLLQLVNNPTQVFAGKTLTAGKYTQIRLEVSKTIITFKDGSTANVTVPSNRFYWVRSFDIVQGKTTTLTLDFNAAQTISQDGQGKYIIAPVAKVVSTTS